MGVFFEVLMQTRYDFFLHTTYESLFTRLTLLYAYSIGRYGKTVKCKTGADTWLREKLREVLQIQWARYQMTAATKTIRKI